MLSKFFLLRISYFYVASLHNLFAKYFTVSLTYLPCFPHIYLCKQGNVIINDIRKIRDIVQEKAKVITNNKALNLYREFHRYVITK